MNFNEDREIVITRRGCDELFVGPGAALVEPLEDGEGGRHGELLSKLIFAGVDAQRAIQKRAQHQDRVVQRGKN